MNRNGIFLVILSVVASVAAPAFAATYDYDGTKVIQLGERTYANGYVRCDDSVPTPAPTPRERRPIYRTSYVTIRPNVSCLQSIPVTDGKSVMRAAQRCDSNNTERRALKGDCTLVRLSVRHDLADSVIRKANTVIYENQKEEVRSASAIKEYECQELVGYE